MERRIVGFHQDDEHHWVAELECGHGQHVRHDPPWQHRPWVLDPVGRAEHLDSVLNCVRCDADPPAVGRIDAYTEARLSGLCEDGAEEVARRKR